MSSDFTSFHLNVINKTVRFIKILNTMLMEKGSWVKIVKGTTILQGVRWKGLSKG